MIKTLEMRLSWTMWVRPESSDECPSGDPRDRRDRDAEKVM